MKNAKLALVALSLIVGVSLSCKLLKGNDGTDSSIAPVIDFTTPSEGVNVKVVLDKKHTSSGKVGKSGGSVSLKSADGSKFTLDIPANALDSEATITMTAIKTLDGAPLDSNAPTAVQLEPSGLFFNDLVTLTIVPAKEIPIKQQIAFGYEGDGQDYHMALVDPKTKEIKIKLMGFSGAGVGSASDAAWAVNLQIQAETARTRLTQKTAEILQAERHRQLLGDESGSEEATTQIISMTEQYYDQVVQKSVVSAELDCRLASRAIRDILGLERQIQLLGYRSDPEISKIVDKKVMTEEKVREIMDKLVKLGKECKKPAAFQIVGGLDDFQTSTKVCDILQPFTLTGGGFKNEFSGGFAGTYRFTGPFQSEGSGTYTISLPDGLDKPGTMTGHGSGSVLGQFTGSGTEKYTLTPIEPCGESGQ